MLATIEVEHECSNNCGSKYQRQLQLQLHIAPKAREAGTKAQSRYHMCKKIQLRNENRQSVIPVQQQQ